ncbi:MAG TPA: MFS transporter [Candidatus Dietzia intestinigallinarum]|nr:MFS transporter [Candidatus Dietzia intestinigallinarum]
MSGSEPGADRVEPRPVGAGWIVALALGVVAVFASWFGPLQILLPAQTDLVAGPGGREALLALVVGTGAAVALVANPLWGLVSDRCRTRLGTRMPVVYAGTALGVVGQVVLFGATTGPVILTGWVLVQLGLNGPFAVLAALIADRVPTVQRGLVGSLFGVGQIVGVIAGTVVAEAVGAGTVGYLLLAGITPVLLVAIVLADRAAPTSVRGTVPGTPATGAGGPRGFRPTRDYVWAWLLRFLMNLTNAILLIYLFFFLDEVVQVEDVAGSVLVVTVITLVLSAVCAGVTGAVSDRMSRRRVFAVAGALATAGGLILLALATTLPLVLLAAAVLGLGWGLFIGVDMAIITSTLADDATSGTLLGLANIANSLPQVVAPVLAAPIVLSAAGYPALYGVGAGIAVAAALCTLPLRSVR